MREPEVKQHIVIKFLNGDTLVCNNVWNATETNTSLNLIYEKCHTHYPMCNIKSILYQYKDMM